MKTLLMPLFTCAAAALALSTSSAVTVEGVSFAGPPSGPWRRLFLDASVVEQQTGLERVFHAAEKHTSNPVLKVDKPWEGRGYGATVHGGTVMWDEGKLRMWYIGGKAAQGSAFRICYAESRDGLAWDKPALGIIEFQGSRENNIVLDEITEPELSQLSYVTFVSVMKRLEEKDPHRRYALYGFYHTIERKDGRFSKFVHLRPRVAFSPDGLRWSFLPDPEHQGLFPSSDVVRGRGVDAVSAAVRDFADPRYAEGGLIQEIEFARRRLECEGLRRVVAQRDLDARVFQQRSIAAAGGEWYISPGDLGGLVRIGLSAGTRLPGTDRFGSALDSSHCVYLARKNVPLPFFAPNGRFRGRHSNCGEAAARAAALLDRRR